MQNNIVWRMRKIPIYKHFLLYAPAHAHIHIAYIQHTQKKTKRKKKKSFISVKKHAQKLFGQLSSTLYRLLQSTRMHAERERTRMNWWQSAMLGNLSVSIVDLCISHIDKMGRSNISTINIRRKFDKRKLKECHCQMPLEKRTSKCIETHLSFYHDFQMVGFGYLRFELPTARKWIYICIPDMKGKETDR